MNTKGQLNIDIQFNSMVVLAYYDKGKASSIMQIPLHRYCNVLHNHNTQQENIVSCVVTLGDTCRLHMQVNCVDDRLSNHHFAIHGENSNQVVELPMVLYLFYKI